MAKALLPARRLNDILAATAGLGGIIGAGIGAASQMDNKPGDVVAGALTGGAIGEVFGGAGTGLLLRRLDQKIDRLAPALSRVK